MKVVEMPWPTYRRWIEKRAKAGEHGVIVGSTGSGKSILAREVVPMFGVNIVALDGKGGDDPSLKGIDGFRLIRDWPPQEEASLLRALRVEAARQPIRVVLAPKKEKLSDLPRNRDVFKAALGDLFTRRGRKVFTVYVDELGELADPRKMGLGQQVEVLLQQMRYRGGSIITAMQFPTWLPKSMYRETTHRWMFRVADTDSVNFLASILGDRKEVTPVLRSLKRHEFLYSHVHMPDTFIISKVNRSKEGSK